MIKLFTQDKCPKCPAVKEMLKGHDIKEYDINSVDGMSEAAFYSVMGTPTTIIVDSDGNELDSWRSMKPNMERLIKLCA